MKYLILGSFFYFVTLINGQIQFHPSLNIGYKATLGWCNNKIIENTAPQNFEMVKSTAYGNFVTIGFRPIAQNNIFLDLQLFKYNCFYLGIGVNGDNAVITNNVNYKYIDQGNPTEIMSHNVLRKYGSSESIQFGLSIGMDYSRNKKVINRLSIYNSILRDFSYPMPTYNIFEFEEGNVSSYTYDPTDGSPPKFGYCIRLRYDIIFKTTNKDRPKFGFFIALQTGFKKMATENVLVQVIGTNKRIVIESSSTNKNLMGGIYYTFNFFKK